MERSHFHDQYEILLTLSGEAEMFVTNRCYPLQRLGIINIHVINSCTSYYSRYCKQVKNVR